MEGSSMMKSRMTAISNLRSILTSSLNLTSSSSLLVLKARPKTLNVRLELLVKEGRVVRSLWLVSAEWEHDIGDYE